VRVVLTGANGFVGSHVLRALLSRGCRVAILLRRTSNTRLIAEHLHRVSVHYGSLSDLGSLRDALREADAVIHAAGKTKATRPQDYCEVNVDGTRRLVEACNEECRSLGRFILISSLSAAGPGVPERPAAETDPPRPVSAYGRSKLLAEHQVRSRSRWPYIVLRPAAVYGPGDRDFLMAFRTIRFGVAPLINPSQRVSLIFAADLAEAVIRALECRRAGGATYNLAHREPYSQVELSQMMVSAMGGRARRMGIPVAALYAAGMLMDLRAAFTSRTSILTVAKVPEYLAPGWVCSTERAERELDFVARTPLREGLRITVDWYRQKGWL